jgi:hypothetical protein
MIPLFHKQVKLLSQLLNSAFSNWFVDQYDGFRELNYNCEFGIIEFRDKPDALLVLKCNLKWSRVDLPCSKCLYLSILRIPCIFC